MTDKLSVKPKILELNNSNDIYMTLNMVILSNDVNYNDAQFLDDFIDGVIDNKDFYTGVPLVVNREKLENAEYEDLTHELNNGVLETDQIGSFIDFWKDEVDGANCLLGSIRVFKRYTNTCNAIIELYENGDLETSVEVLVNSYSEITDEGVRKIHYNEGKNCLIGSCIVSDPAEVRAKATLLVAEAHKLDMEEQKGDVNMPKKETEVFNKGHEITYHGKLETASLKFSEVSNQVYNLLNPIDAKNGGRDYNFWIRDLYTDYVIAEDWDNYDDLWKIPYSISNDVVTLAAKEDWQKGHLGFIPEGVELASKESEIADLQEQLNKAKEELETMSEENKGKVEEKVTEVSELQSKIDELNELLVSEKESKGKLEEQITELNSKVEELSPFKENFEKAEKEKKVAELSDKYSKLLSEETMKSERVQNAIQELNSVELNSVVVEEIAKQKTEVEVASKDSEDVVITASKQEDLINKNILQKYGLEG